MRHEPYCLNAKSSLLILERILLAFFYIQPLLSLKCCLLSVFRDQAVSVYLTLSHVTQIVSSSQMVIHSIMSFSARMINNTPDMWHNVVKNKTMLYIHLSGFKDKLYRSECEFTNGILYLTFLPKFPEMEMSFWQNVHRWLHWKLQLGNSWCRRCWQFHQNDNTPFSIMSISWEISYICDITG